LIDHPFIVLTETKFGFRCIPVGIGTLLNKDSGNPKGGFRFLLPQNLKKISYHSHRNFLQPQTSKNLLRKWSRFCKNIL
jgi:hypothetical protein